MTQKSLVPVAYVERMILEIRGRKVILDSDLASLYGVETRALNQAVRRNERRFPDDFQFRLTQEEKAKVITECDHLVNLRFSPHLPIAFTEHGALMVASVLNSEAAVAMSVSVVRAFVRLRAMISSQAETLRKLEELEARVGEHDKTLVSLVAAVRQLMLPPATPRPTIGFTAPESSTHVL
jgi:hypothetical protein